MEVPSGTFIEARLFLLPGYSRACAGGNMYWFLVYSLQPPLEPSCIVIRLFLRIAGGKYLKWILVIFTCCQSPE